MTATTATNADNDPLYQANVCIAIAHVLSKRTEPDIPMEFALDNHEMGHIDWYVFSEMYIIHIRFREKAKFVSVPNDEMFDRETVVEKTSRDLAEMLPGGVGLKQT